MLRWGRPRLRRGSSQSILRQIILPFLVSEPPRVLVEVEAAGKVISKTVGATYGFAESSGEDRAGVSRKASSGKIDQNTVTLMLVSQPSEEHVSVCLRDAATGSDSGDDWRSPRLTSLSSGVSKLARVGCERLRRYLPAR